MEIGERVQSCTANNNKKMYSLELIENEATSIIKLVNYRRTSRKGKLKISNSPPIIS